jgi:hypothetical protein
MNDATSTHPPHNTPACPWTARSCPPSRCTSTGDTRVIRRWPMAWRPAPTEATGGAASTSRRTCVAPQRVRHAPRAGRVAMPRQPPTMAWATALTTATVTATAAGVSICGQSDSRRNDHRPNEKPRSRPSQPTLFDNRPPESRQSHQGGVAHEARIEGGGSRLRHPSHPGHPAHPSHPSKALCCLVPMMTLMDRRVAQLRRREWPAWGAEECLPYSSGCLLPVPCRPTYFAPL